MLVGHSDSRRAMNLASYMGIAFLAAVIASAIRSIPVLLRELFDAGEEEDGTDR